MHVHHHLVTRAWDFWLARLAVAVCIGLQLMLQNNFSFGPYWLAPAIEGVLLVILAGATFLAIQKSHAHNTHKLDETAKFRRWVKYLAVLLTIIITISNFIALLALVRALLAGKAGGGLELLFAALDIWVTNVLAFALWYWNTDRGGPSTRGLHNHEQRDFQFLQMTTHSKLDSDWMPGFVDYLFLSFTNATAFSPTDTLPITHRAKLLMMPQAAASLLVVALVAARAVNILS